jgi:hypothetical protein
MSIKVKYITKGDYIELVANTGDVLKLDLHDNREHWNVELVLTDNSTIGFWKNADEKKRTLVINKAVWTCNCNFWYFDNFKGIKSYFKNELLNEFTEFLNIVNK